MPPLGFHLRRSRPVIAGAAGSVIAANGGSVIDGAAGSVIAANGGPVIAGAAGPVIAANGGSVIAGAAGSSLAGLRRRAGVTGHDLPPPRLRHDVARIRARFGRGRCGQFD